MLPHRPRVTAQQRRHLVDQYLPIVKKIASGLARRATDPVDDLVQVGSIGLLEAIDRYEEGHGTEFKTYAIHLITGHIRHYLRDKQSLLRGPRALQELSYRLSLLTQEFAQKLGRDPTNYELAAALQVPESTVDEARVYDRRVSVLWLDQINFTQEEDESLSLMESITDPNTLHDGRDEAILLSDAISRLDPAEREILELRYFQDLTQAELSRRLNLSPMKICRHLKRAERRLRFMLIAEPDRRRACDD